MVTFAAAGVVVSEAGSNPVRLYTPPGENEKLGSTFETYVKLTKLETSSGLPGV
jgi:hypothetical protein